MNSKLIFFVLIFPCALAWVQEMEDKDLYEGDIVLSPDQKERLNQGKFVFGSIKDNLWKSPIAYDFSEDIAGSWRARRAIRLAIDDYHRYTCIRFVRRTDERSYIRFYKGDGCSSPVGHAGVNSISLASGCWGRSTVIHEIAHSLGKMSRFRGIRLDPNFIHFIILF